MSRCPGGPNARLYAPTHPGRDPAHPRRARTCRDDDAGGPAASGGLTRSAAALLPHPGRPAGRGGQRRGRGAGAGAAPCGRPPATWVGPSGEGRPDDGPGVLRRGVPGRPGAVGGGAYGPGVTGPLAHARARRRAGAARGHVRPARPGGRCAGGPGSSGRAAPGRAAGSRTDRSDAPACRAPARGGRDPDPTGVHRRSTREPGGAGGHRSAPAFSADVRRRRTAGRPRPRARARCSRARSAARRRRR